MSWVKQRYRDISPMTLQVVGGDVSSSLYCAEVEGVAGGLVESFLVELYRCKLCQFTCGLKATISSHLLLRHRPTTYMGGAEGGDGTEAGLQQGASPYQLKPSDEDEDFLLYNMLDNISPPTCDISSEGGLQVAHTCEVTTLFEEEEEEEEQEEEVSSIFPLKGGSMSCPSDSPASQEETAQSAHLMTLGLCRISAVRPPPPLPPSSSPRTQSPTPPDNPTHLQDSGADDRVKVPPPNLLCLLCPLTLPSQRLLNIHIRSHRASGGFSCVRCSWTADSWEELEHHWRSHSSRRRKRRREWEQQEKKDKKKKKTMAACQRTFRSSTLQNAPEKSQKHDGWRSQRIGQGKQKEVELPDRRSSRPQAGSQPGATETAKKAIRMKNRDRKETTAENGKQTGFSCSLCHRKFSSKLTLRRHLGIHKGEKPFTCPHCSYSSRLKASLLQHLRTHTGEKPYRCAECPYASIDRSSLLRHCRTHSQEKPYRCQHCDYSSIQKKSLDLHARRHHTGEVFPCQHCDYSSPDRQLLLRHIRRHHAPSQHAAFLT
ncbi:oocyte zinc finger protein XlCOF6 [Archocentrus centrarchus]|uniref:oocyte zinc finger protein XlCOF6 n=1 Tax=Archocentrus centrarchus TaxID=63155 RepID=UPI0011EA3F04|nr:oocyte zinc finger protein XlCOF6-like [Archocentrus centrarchus]XP_030607362.1 oocyte zinc finger protein XlCOF6-like [Archocentrus centrarchus]XP_030607363.1 oocyte zinc finger protein XlCOF6-like [Archocentrus centrarchus]